MKSKKQHQQQLTTSTQQTDHAPNSNQTQQQQQKINPSSQSESPTSPPEQYTFGSQPISIKCPFCKHRTKTQIIMKPQLISIMLALVLFSILPNAIMIIAIVIILQVTATKRHRCALCQRQLGTDGKFLAVFTDRVYSFSIGENGLLVSKKILITITLFLMTILVIYIRSQIQHSYVWIDLTWQKLKASCPANSASPNCNAENIQKTIKNWKGYVMRVQDRRQSLRRYYDYAIQLYIKMQPSQHDAKTPDIYLTGSSSKIFEMAQVFDEINHGDQIIFNGTFLIPGRGLTMSAANRHLQLIGLQKTGVNNPKIEIYMTAKQQDYFNKKVEGKALRQENKQN